MEIFEGRYFHLNKTYLTIVGLWPYATGTRHLIRAIVTISLFLLMTPQLIAPIVNYHDTDRVMLSVMTVLIAMVMLLKIVALTISEGNLMDLYRSIADNWLVIQNAKEREILIEYSERARKLTIFYGASMAMFGTMISMLPLTPKILDVFAPLDEPRPNIYLLQGEYFIDNREDYFIVLFFCDAAITWLVIGITVAADTMYVASSEHCCAINAILSYRLRSLGQRPLANLAESEDDTYNKLIHVVRLHQKTFSFTSTMNSSYSLNFLFIMTVYLLIIPLNARGIIATLRRPLLMLGQYAILFVAIKLHLFVFFWVGQRILDHSHNVRYDAYCSDWQVMSVRTRKLLLTVMLRCNHPASLHAGGLFLINFETFSTVVRTALSYITALSSFR